jgi:glycosyltransferase involved in cell wall biosynthesis
MTWLFEMEKKRMAEGKIRTFLYQNEDVRVAQSSILGALNPNAKVNFITFKPYLDLSRFPFVQERCSEFFGCGRISRQDTDKYAPNTLHIYEYFVAPKLKRGLFLGFDQRSEQKIGKPWPWIRTALNQNECSQQEFYRHCQIVLQPSDTTENWPRVGLEAMASGSVLIVDNRGGWRRQIEHGITGWLCNHERDFIYYASKMAYEPEVRIKMASRARERVQLLAGAAVSQESWADVFRWILQ